MAVVAGQTIAGASFPLRNSGLGPYRSTGGNFYVVLRQSTTRLNVYKSTAPLTSAFAAVGTPPTAEATEIEAVGTTQDGNIIHVAWQIASGVTNYAQFNMSTDAWGATESISGAATQAPNAGATWVSLVARSTEVVAGYQAGDQSSMNLFTTCAYKRRTATNTWSAAVTISNGGSISYGGPNLVLGAADRVHFLIWNVTGGDMASRTLSAANALSTYTEFDVQATALSSLTPMGMGGSYDASGTMRVRWPYRIGATGNPMKQASLDSADAPTVTGADISTTLPLVANSSYAFTGPVDSANDTHYLLFIGSATSDLLVRSRVEGGAWSAETAEWVATLSAGVTANVYDHATDRVVGVASVNGGTVQYAHLDVGTAVGGATTTLTQSTFRGRNDDGTETTATWKATAGTDWTQVVDTNFRVRFNIADSVAAATQNTAFVLRYSLNGGAYTAVSGASSVVRATASANVADGAATTEQLAGAGAFNAGTIDEVDGSALGFTAATSTGQDTEVEYCVQIRSADVVDADVVNLRVYNGSTALDAYTDTPIITVSEAAPPTTSLIWDPIGLLTRHLRSR